MANNAILLLRIKKCEVRTINYVLCLFKALPPLLYEKYSTQ